jgi:hypothetical protein
MHVGCFDMAAVSLGRTVVDGKLPIAARTRIEVLDQVYQKGQISDEAFFPIETKRS